MSQTLLKKIDHIENLLTQINAKMDNFLGFEDINSEEKNEIKVLRKEIRSEGSVNFDDVFED